MLTKKEKEYLKEIMEDYDCDEETAIQFAIEDCTIALQKPMGKFHPFYQKILRDIKANQQSSKKKIDEQKNH